MNAPAEIPESMIQAGAEVRLRQYGSEYSEEHLTWRDFADEVREVLEAALADEMCEATTDGEVYTGEPGLLTCTKWARHRGQHRSAEGATW